MEISGGLIMIIIVIGIAALVVIASVMENKKRSKMTPDELKAYLEAKERKLKEFKEMQKVRREEFAWGTVSPLYVCPHCQTKGFVRTMSVKRKKGISGAKATGALLTAGVSILATGLSRKEGLTQAHCGNCNSTWDF